MKFEIENEFDKTFETHTIKKKTISIGRSKECDIAINAEGMSRKHVEITEKPDGSYTIKDLESSNGTFINDERLEPNKEVEFTFFFPAKLGLGIIVSLVEDDSASDGAKAAPKDDAASFLASQGIKAPASASKTKTDFKIEAPKARSGTLGNGKQIGNTRKSGKNDKVEDKKKSKAKKTSSPIMKILIFGGLFYFYYEYFVKEKIETDNSATVVQKTAENSNATPQNKAVEVVKPKVFQFPMDPAQVVIKDKCFTNDEKYFCNSLNKSSVIDGVFILGDTLYLAFDGVKEYQRLNSSLSITPEEVPHLELLAKKQQGIKFSKVIFLKSNYKIGVTSKEELSDYLAASIVINSPFIKAFLANTNLTKLAIVPYRNSDGKNQPLTQALIKKEDLNQLMAQGNDTIMKAYKYAFISGYKFDFKNVIWKYFNLP